MKKEIADKWVEALRSGKYKQGIGSLRNSNNEFCCLGVLCEISGQGEWKGNQYSGISNFLPLKIMEWAEIKHHSGIFDYEYCSSLVTSNDNGESFEHIANIIEENWEEL